MVAWLLAWVPLLDEKVEDEVGDDEEGECDEALELAFLWSCCWLEGSWQFKWKRNMWKRNESRRFTVKSQSPMVQLNM